MCFVLTNQLRFCGICSGFECSVLLRELKSGLDFGRFKGLGVIEFLFALFFLLLSYYRFHSLEEFDEGKRSCRKRLDGHNRRRRKPQTDLLPRSAGPFSYHQGWIFLTLLKEATKFS